MATYNLQEFYTNGLGFVPITCEWVNADSSKCNCKPKRGKSYCDEHHGVVYSRVSADEFTKTVSSKIDDCEYDIDACDDDNLI